MGDTFARASEVLDRDGDRFPAPSGVVGPLSSLEVVSMPPGLAKSLAVAQAAVGNAELDGTSGQSRSRYASRESIALAAKAALASAGLAFFAYDTRQSDQSLTVRYVLSHESGEAIVIRTGVPMGDGGRMSPEQRRGAAESYCYKYALLSLLNIPRSEGDPDEGQSQTQTGSSRPPHPEDFDPGDLAKLLAQARSLLRADPHWARSDDPAVVAAGRRREGQIKVTLERLPEAHRAQLLEKYRDRKRSKKQIWARYNDFKRQIGEDGISAIVGSIPGDGATVDDWASVVRKLEEAEGTD